jgi:hypothetical protein
MVGEGVDARVDKEAEAVIVSRGPGAVLRGVAGALRLLVLFTRGVPTTGAHGVNVDIAEDDLAGCDY